MVHNSSCGLIHVRVHGEHSKTYLPTPLIPKVDQQKVWMKILYLIYEGELMHNAHQTALLVIFAIGCRVF